MLWLPRAAVAARYCLWFDSLPTPVVMVCYVNNAPHETPEAALLAELLARLALADQRGVAVAVNDAVVPRAEWAAHALREQDRVTIIRATQGG